MKDRTSVIARIAQAFHRQKRALYGQGPERYGITPLQLHFLLHLKTAGASSLKDLAARFRMTGSAATQVVDSLEEKGYIRRTVSSHDRRLRSVALSRKAAAGLTTLQARHTRLLAAILKPLSDHELRTFLALNEKISAHLESHDIR